MRDRLEDILSIRVHPHFREQLNRVAATRPCSLSEAVRAALSQYIAQNSKPPEKPDSFPAPSAKMAA